MMTTFQKATSAMFSKALGELLPKERRSHGADIRIWNDRDPRVDQSYFNGSVPGFVLSHDNTIVDWNVGFEMIFGSCQHIKRGVNVKIWYELIENFRRVSPREEKLHGDGMLPITDRDRVVFKSEVYGRMVFTKLMSPVLDRVTGRIIGWNIALNINSVTERVKFFSDLDQRIQNASKHARHVMGFDQVAAKSKILHEAIHRIVVDIDQFEDVLVLGALGARPVIEELLNFNPRARVSVMDNDAEALRHLRHHLSIYGKRVKIVRRGISDLSIVPDDRFDTAIILWPKLTNETLERVLAELKHKLSDRGRISIVSWAADEGAAKFWDAVRRDLEERHEIDLIRWHLPLIKEESETSGVAPLEAGAIIAKGLAHIVEFATKSGKNLSKKARGARV